MYGVLNLDTPPASAQVPPPLSFSNPVYELSNPAGGDANTESSLIRSGESSVTSSRANSAVTATLNQDTLSSPTGTVTAYKVEHILAPGSGSFGSFRRLREGMDERIKVARSIFPYMTGIALAYCVTLSLYPGLESEIISCRLKSWMPVLLMFTFNLTDVIGKLLAAVPYNWSRRQLILMSSLRALLIPLLLLCVAPRKNPTISGEIPAFMFTAALGISNGLAGSLPMLIAPQKVAAPQKEMTGNIMTISYMSGLTAGSLVGYVFENMLGPPTAFPCLQYPYVPKTPEELETTTQLIQMTTAQLMNKILANLTSSLIPTTTELPTDSTTISNYMNASLTNFVGSNSTLLNDN